MREFGGFGTGERTGERATKAMGETPDGVLEPGTGSAWMTEEKKRQAMRKQAREDAFARMAIVID